MTILESFRSDYWFYIYSKRDGTDANSNDMVQTFDCLVWDNSLTFYNPNGLTLTDFGENKYIVERNDYLFSVFSYVQHPSFIEREFATDINMEEKKYWYICIVAQWSYLFVKKSSWLNSLNKDDLWRLSLRKLWKIERDRLLQKYNNLIDLDMKNTRLSWYSTQKISVDKDSLVDITPIQQMYNYYARKTKVRGNAQSQNESLSINNGTSRCAYSSIGWVWSIENLFRHCSDINTWLTEETEDDWTLLPFLEHLIQPADQNQINDLQDLDGGLFYFDLNGIKKSLEEEDGIEPADVDAILDEYSDIYSLRINNEQGNDNNEQGNEMEIFSEDNNIGILRINNRELVLLLNDDFWRDHRCNQIVIRNELYFAFWQNYTYSQWNFYQRRNFENEYNVEDLIRIFHGNLWINTCGEKNYLVNQENRNQRISSEQENIFHIHSIFWQIENRLARNDNVSSCLVNWDMWSEVADYIFLTNDEICLIHAKSNNETARDSASVSNFHDVIGQALKNIWELDNIINIRNKLTPEYMQWDVNIDGSQYRRVRAGENNLDRLWCRRNLFLKKKIILAIDFFTRQRINNFLGNIDQNSHKKRQMINLLLELVLSAKYRGIEVEIRCKSDN